jgi:hypothetical protein
VVVSDSSDDAGENSEERFERDRFDVERVADDPVGAFFDDEPTEESADTAPTTVGADVDIDPDLSQMFWKLVLLYNFSVIGTTLGVLLLVFDKGPNVGPELLASGLVLLGYSVFRTRRAKARIDAGEFHDDPGEEPTSASADGGHPMNIDGRCDGGHPMNTDTGGGHPASVGTTGDPGGVETREPPAADDSPEGDA